MQTFPLLKVSGKRSRYLFSALRRICGRWFSNRGVSSLMLASVSSTPRLSDCEGTGG